MLVGLPGAGKSTLSSALAKRVDGLRVLNKDEVRHALFDPCDYTAAERSISFSAMLDAARYHLGRGRVVVLDGLALQRPGEAEAVAAAAAESGAFVATIVCDVPVDVAMARADADVAAGVHRATNRDGSAVRRLATEMREPAGDYLTVDMTGDIELAADEVLGYIEDAAQ
jgi:predicted kinase